MKQEYTSIYKENRISKKDVLETIISGTHDIVKHRGIRNSDWWLRSKNDKYNDIEVPNSIIKQIENKIEFDSTNKNNDTMTSYFKLK